MFHMTARTLITTEGINVTEFDIGSFGNKQTDAVGANLFQQICEKISCCIRQLAGTRAKEVQAHRFLENETVTIEAINEGALRNANKNCIGIKHVICPFDTVVSGYPTQSIMKQDFGTTTHENTQGFHLHGSLLMNAENKQVLSVGHLNPWVRNIVDESNTQDRLPEEKESFKWQNCVQNVISSVTSPERLTFVADREADIFSLFEYITEQKRDFIIRAQYDRKLVTGGTISEHFSEIDKFFCKTVKLQRTRTRLKKRVAILEVKYSQIEIKNTEKDGESLKLYCVIAVETGNIPKGETPISWVLLTSHKITTDQQASQILDWYTWRWTIEEIHRAMKNKGLQIEDSQIQDPEKLLKLSMLIFASAVKIMALVCSRNGNEQLAETCFSESELIFIAIACLKLEGKTDKLKNRYTKGSMGWAAWVIARLGGWKGYNSECPPGPITMRIGLERFQTMHEGWSFGNPQ
jgi:Transposase DDE domain